MAEELNESYNAPVVDAIEIEAEEIDEVSEALAVMGIISEERHNQLLEEVNQCRDLVVSLSTKVQTEESPTLTMILERLMQIQIELADLKKSMKPSSDSNPSNTLPSESAIVIAPPPEVIPNPDEPKAEESMVEPSGVDAEPPKPEAKKKKYRVL